jgi:hypothetical protein
MAWLKNKSSNSGKVASLAACQFVTSFVTSNCFRRSKTAEAIDTAFSVKRGGL